MSLMFDKSRKDELLQEAERLLAAEGRDGLKQWLLEAKDFFPAAIDISMDFIRLAVHHGLVEDAGPLLRQVCRAHPLRLEILELLGKYTRSSQPLIGPPIHDGSVPADPADSAFVTVIGNSHVRSFASGTRFFPLFIGPGRSLTFLTPELAAVTQRMTFANLARVDPRSLVMLMCGNGDVLSHSDNDYGTWTAVENGSVESHGALIAAAAERYCDMVAEIRRRHALNLVLFCAVPMLDPRQMPLVETFNATIRAFGQRSGIPVLDLTDRLKDPATGCLKEDLRSAEGDFHVSHALILLVEEGLDAFGLLPKQRQAFSWEYMFRLAVDPAVETRIWSEPLGTRNMVGSRRVMFSQIIERAAHIFIGRLAVQPGTVLVINGREGFIPLELTPALAPEITSVDPVPESALMARRIARFAGRADVNFVTRPLVEIATGGKSYDYAFMVVHQTDDAAACSALLPSLTGKVRRGVFILTALDWNALVTTLGGYQNVLSIDLANRFTKDYWIGAKLYILLR
jgi:hypothetical protein